MWPSSVTVAVHIAPRNLEFCLKSNSKDKNANKLKMPCKQWREEAVGRGLLLQLLTLEVNKSGSARNTIVGVML